VDPSESCAGHGELVDLLAKLEADVAERRASGALNKTLGRWRTHHEELTIFDDLEGLIGFIRNPDRERHGSKDFVLAALCVEGRGGDDDAALLLVWLMLPGLLLLRRRLATHGALNRDELDAELLAGVWESAARVRPATTYVAKRLLDGARRRVMAAIRREEDWTGRTEPLTPGREGSAMSGVDSEGLHDFLAEGVGAGVISAVDAELLRASRAVIPTLRARLGISECAARSRRHRAKRRLLDWLATNSTMAPQFEPLGPPQEVPTESLIPHATDGTYPSPL
jgi:hypothetical protein